MTDHIIKAAREAEAYATSQTADIVDWKAIAQERFWAIAFKAGMERAAEICEAEQDRAEEARADARFKAALKDGDERNAVDRGTHWMAVHTTNAVLRNAAKAIRAHDELAALLNTAADRLGHFLHQDAIKPTRRVTYTCPACAFSLERQE